MRSALLLAAASLALAAAGTAQSRTLNTTCQLPVLHGYHFITLTATHLTCDHAAEGAKHYVRYRHLTGFICEHSVSGRDVTVTCTSHGRTQRIHFVFRTP